MVEIREETSEQNEPSGSNEPRSNTASSQQRTTVLMDFLKANPTEALCFLLRQLTVYFAAVYMLTMSNPEYQKTVYFKAFAAAAATNAFRLHQRVRGSTNPTFSREFLQEVMLEDSAHYLLYSLIFPTSTPVSMALIPITLYAIWQSLAFVIKVASLLNYSNNNIIQKLNQFKTAQTENVLGLIACSEIFLFPIFFAMIFMGKANIFFPFLYYRFLAMRYISRRNPYTRLTFANMKMSLYQVAASPSCPAIIQTVIYKSVALIERLSPI
uniref:Transmembrane protein 33 n=1 Tax=Acrobeloides nanus TaxID=290746 RepID=A0A914DLB6_9BILA